MFAYFLTDNFRKQWQKTWSLAWPVIIANLSLPLLSLADAAILGHLPNSVYLAGVTVGSSLMAYLFGGFNFLSMGLSGFSSQALGKKDYADVLLNLKKYTVVALGLVLLVGLGHNLFISAGLSVINPSEQIAHEANTYLTIRMLGVPAIIFNTMLLGFFIGLQNTRVSLYSLSLTQILNIGFNILFVYGFGLKTAGIAIGTVISEYLGLMLVLWHLRKTLATLVPKIKESKKIQWYWSAFLPIFHVSSHLFVRTFVLLTTFVWFNRVGATFGPVELASNGILLVFFTLISYFLDGTAAAAEAQTGHAYGQGDHKKLRQVWLTSALLNIVFMFSLCAVFIVLGERFLALLTNQNDILSHAQAQLKWIVLLPLSGGIAFWLDGVFIGARRSRDMRNSVLIAFSIFILSSWLFVESNSQLWLAFNLFFVIRSIWLLIIFSRKMLIDSA